MVMMVMMMMLLMMMTDFQDFQDFQNCTKRGAVSPFGASLNKKRTPENIPDSTVTLPRPRNAIHSPQY